MIAGSSQGRFYMKRFTSAGLADASFGSSSDLFTDLTQSSEESIKDFAFQSDGRIVAVGWATIAGARTYALTRYNTNGTLDTSFGFLGGTLTDFGGPSQAFGVAIDGSGRAVVAGNAVNGGSGRFALARYATNGLPDNGFDGDGKLTTIIPPQAFAQANDIAIDSSGRIVLTGFAFGTEGVAAAVARYKATGSLDTGFDSDGIVKLQVANMVANAVKVQGTKILIGGTANGGALVWRLNANGSVDTSFGFQGASEVTFFNQLSAQVVAMEFASDGRIRLGADVTDNDGKQLLAYSVLSANGGTFADRVFPEHQGTVLPGLSATVASAIAVHGDRVFVSGTNTTLGRPGAALVVTQPDRTSDTQFADPLFGVAVAMAPDPFILADRAFLAPNNDDVALLHLDTGAFMNGSRTNFTFAGFHPNPPSLVGSNVICRGYGNNSVDAAGNQAGFGTLRQGTSRVVSVFGSYLELGFVPSAAPEQLPLKGDSGSSCAFNGLLTSVHSRGSTESVVQINAARFATWANGLIQTP